MISKRSLLLILYLAITGCTMDCVEPGLQSRNTSINVNVPVHKADEGVKIHWVDSGQMISKGETIKFTLGGSINFCSPKEGRNPRKVLVPAAFCADSSEPDYEKAKNINDDKLTDNFGLNEQEVCKNVGFGNSQSYSKRRYVDTGIKVNPGDKLSFSLVPRKITIDYDNPERKGISFDDNCYKAVKNDRGETVYKKATVSEIHEGGEFFFDGKDGTKNKIKFSSLDRTKAKEKVVLVGNGYTPYDNKVHFNVEHIGKQTGKPWMNGALLDLRLAKIGLDELCNGKKCDLNEVKKYSSYELNCYYQNICYNKEGTWKGNPPYGNCVSSIRYKKYDKSNTCNMYSYLKEVENKLKEIEKNKGDSKRINIDFTSNTGKDTEDISWAEALVAKIGDSDDQDTAKGTQCLPRGKEKKEEENDLICSKTHDNFRNFSLKLNHNYQVNKKVKPGSNVMLAIASNGNYHLHRGGYHVEVSRSCEFTDGKKLYMYLGDKPPKNQPADTNDFKRVARLTSITEDNVNYYVIDGSHLENDKSKKIYFGIDVRNVEKDDITDKNGKYYENNKYSINLFVKRRINNFISSNINKIFDFTKKEVIGDSVKDSYKGYAKGLLQGVRALLTLYVIFTVVGYMLGTIQLSKFDFIVRMFKIAFIAFALSDRSWELFGTTLSKLFVDGSTYLVDSFSGYIEEGKKFAFLDLTAGVLFTGETWLKFLSLMLAGPFGFITFLIILHASFTFLTCIISATFKYIISTILVAFLLSLTPLFVVFILFQQTKSLFDNWIKTLAHVSLQPIILFSSLSILNQLMYSVLYNLTNFSACYQCLISINFLSNDFCIMKSILPLGYSPGTSVDVALSDGAKTGGHFAALPIDLIQAFIYLIIASAMEVFVSASETMAQIIFSSGYGVAGSVSRVAAHASQSILSTVGLDYNTQGMIQRIRGAAHKDPVEIKAQLPQAKDKDEQKSSVPDKGKSVDGKDTEEKQILTEEQLKVPDKEKKENDKSKRAGKDGDQQEDYGGATGTSGDNQQPKEDEKKE